MTLTFLYAFHLCKFKCLKSPVYILLRCKVLCVKVNSSCCFGWRLSSCIYEYITKLYKTDPSDAHLKSSDKNKIHSCLRAFGVHSDIIWGLKRKDGRRKLVLVAASNESW